LPTVLFATLTESLCKQAPSGRGRNGDGRKKPWGGIRELTLGKLYELFILAMAPLYVRIGFKPSLNSHIEWQLLLRGFLEMEVFSPEIA